MPACSVRALQLPQGSLITCVRLREWSDSNFGVLSWDDFNIDIAPGIIELE